MNRTSPLLLIPVLSVWLIATSGREAIWISKTLNHPDLQNGGVYLTRGLASDGQGNMFVVLQKERTEQHESKIILTKVSSSLKILWTKEVNAVTGTPFDVTYDERTESAFVVVSDSERNSDGGRGHVIQFSNLETADKGNSDKIRVTTFFSTPDKGGTTKLFACVRNPLNSNLYVIGGTSTSLYRSPSFGKGDIVVVRLDSSGKVLASVQFGSKDDEVGLSIAVNNDGSALAVVAKRLFPSSLSTSEIYRLDPQDLSILDGPHSPFNYGADPLFSPRSVAIIGPVASQSNTYVTFVAGDALVKPDRQADIYVQIYANIQDKVKDVTLTFDGARDMKGVDSCVSAKVGSDGNAYCLGYTETNLNSISRRLNVVVLSPTGELLFRSERNTTDAVPDEETPVALSISESVGGTKLLFVGQTKVSGQRVPTAGNIEIPEGTIPTFKGFSQIVTGAGSVTKPSAPVSTHQPSVAVLAGAVVGGVAVIAVVITGLVMAERRRRQDHEVSKATKTTATEEYTGEVEDAFTDAISPSEERTSGGALV